MVNNTFLNGDLLEDVYMEQPPKFQTVPGMVCKLHKVLYGLKQAPHAQICKLSQCLIDLGFSSSKVDTSLFVQHTNQVTSIVLIYIDDILITSSDNHAIQSLINKFHQFCTKTFQAFTFFLGVKFTYTGNGIHLSQHKYIKSLLYKTSLVDAKSCATSMSSGKQLSKVGVLLDDPIEFRNIVGVPQYCTLVHPEISFTINKLYLFMSQHTDTGLL